MSEKAYKIKTVSGYYYTTANGRYGRINGTAPHEYEALCEHHAKAVAEFLEGVEAQPEIIEIKAAPFAIPCARCKREKERFE